MLISVEKLVRYWGVRPNGVLHVGAHMAEEAPDYVSHGWQGNNGIYWVEGQLKLIPKLKSILDPAIHRVYQGVVWGESGIELDFNIASNSQSSSVFEFGSHSTTYPHISFTSSMNVTSIRLDDLLPKESKFEFLALDIQGAELEAIKGLGTLLDQVKWIYSEVNKKEVYKNCATVSDLDSYLADLGFQRVATRWAFNSGWGDALWIKRSGFWWTIGGKFRTHTDNIWTNFLYVYRYFKRKLFAFAK